MTDIDTNSTHQQHRWLKPLAHIFFMAIIFILPELMMAIAMPHRRGFVFYPGFYVKTLYYIAAFYLNYFIIIDRTLGRPGMHGRYLKFIMWNLLIIAVGLLLSQWLSTVFSHPRRHHVQLSLWAQILKQTSFILRDAVVMILTIGFSVALRLSSLWQDMETRHRELIAEQRSTELASLKSQLNPHFLFNTLNTIYALVDICPEDAKKAVHRLSALLRYMLYQDTQSVPVSLEAGFIEDYISLMQLRLSGRDVKVDIDLGQSEDADIPPLLLIPLVENAFKYGTSAPDETPIEITIRADKDMLECNTRNSFVIKPSSEEGKASGIGLSNLRRRLQLIYGTRAALSTKVEGNIYQTKLRIPLEQ